ncbi:unnamed protein product [Lactuca virosa]|uniref:Uncharacterized protein n=1 Tax=Lactuca virosa TaxID=75947 RepID=A0AAU9MRV1_9ASTR|nr:unnamed protein product [Lactuca virosa]
MITTGNTIENIAEGGSLVQRMRDLDAPEETPQVTTVIKKFVMASALKEHGDEDKELREFESFKRFQAMKKRCEEREAQKKNKEWDYISIHTDQSSDSGGSRGKGRKEKKEGSEDQGRKVPQKHQNTDEHHTMTGGWNLLNIS